MSSAAEVLCVLPVPAPPPEVHYLVACLGPDLTLKLIEETCGTRVHIPMPVNAHRSWLCDVLGLGPLLKLSYEHGGCTIRVPLCRAWRIRVYLHRGGLSQAQIARRVGCTEKQVQLLASPGRPRMPSARRSIGPAASNRALDHDLADAANLLACMP